MLLNTAVGKHRRHGVSGKKIEEKTPVKIDSKQSPKAPYEWLRGVRQSTGNSGAEPG